MIGALIVALTERTGISASHPLRDMAASRDD